MNLKNTAIGAGLLALLIGAHSSQARAQTVSVRVTTDNLKRALASQSPATFTAGSNTSMNTIVVDETQTFQTIEGFGASFTDSAAYLMNEKIPASNLNMVMTGLFDHQNGIGVSFVRNPMGASDISRSAYSYDDLAPGQTDKTLGSFSIAHDTTDIIPLIKLARQINPDLKIMANPWSPPGWMKTSGSMIGGSLLPEMYDALAAYFVKYIQAYASAGIHIDYVSMQNEPLYVPADYPGMSMTPAEQMDLLKNHVLPALAAAGLDTRVLVYDHNWDTPTYPTSVLSDSTISGSDQVAGVAWHGYGGTPGAMNTVQSAFSGKGAYVTELSGGTWVADQVQTDFETITQAMRNWARTFVKWSLALDENHGPHSGGCGTCDGLIVVNSGTGAVSFNPDYYTLGHFSKFVLPGAVRVWSSNAAGLVSAAFRNPDGSKVLVVYNDTKRKQAFQVLWGSESFTYRLKALEGATFTWSGVESGGYTLKATQQIQASSYNAVSGLETESTSDSGGGYDLGYSGNGAWALYKNIDFGSGVRSVDVRVASAGSGGLLEFHLGSSTGPLIGSAVLPVTGGWQVWTTVTTQVSGAIGVNDLYLVLTGTGSIANLNWFRFR